MRCAVIAIATVAALAHAARAERRVVLATSDAELASAAATALSPWGLSVVPLEDPALGADVTRSSERARAIAATHGAGAVVWISAADGRHALWVYDVDDDRAVARRLAAAPPYDDATAAAVALSIKTLLRHSAVAPERERYAAGALAASRAAITTAHFESSVGLRLRSGDGDAEPRLGLGAGWWPHARVGVELRLQSGPGVAVDQPGFVGRFTDTTVAIGGRARFSLGATVSLLPEAVAALHVTELDGAVLDRDQRAHVSRANPAGQLATTIEWNPLPELAIGLRVGGAYLLRKQRYLVAGEPVFTLSSAEWTAAVVLRTRLF